jgi:hypothetical protein
VHCTYTLIYCCYCCTLCIYYRQTRRPGERPQTLTRESGISKDTAAHTFNSNTGNNNNNSNVYGSSLDASTADGANVFNSAISYNSNSGISGNNNGGNIGHHGSSSSNTNTNASSGIGINNPPTPPGVKTLMADVSLVSYNIYSTSHMLYELEIQCLLSYCVIISSVRIVHCVHSTVVECLM